MPYGDPQTPNCRSMIAYLLETDGYSSMSQEQMENDPMLKLVASSCNMEMGAVVALVEKMRNEHESRTKS
jgi:hypothetical protein